MPQCGKIRRRRKAKIFVSRRLRLVPSNDNSGSRRRLPRQERVTHSALSCRWTASRSRPVWFVIPVLSGILRTSRLPYRCCIFWQPASSWLACENKLSGGTRTATMPSKLKNGQTSTRAGSYSPEDRLERDSRSPIHNFRIIIPSVAAVDQRNEQAKARFDTSTTLRGEKTARLGSANGSGSADHRLLPIESNKYFETALMFWFIPNAVWFWSENKAYRACFQN